MIKRFQQWFFRVLGGTVLFGACIVLINCIVDPYGILRNDFSKQFQEPNQNFAKTKFILNNKGKYDSFLFGSSRVIFIDNTKIRTGAYYNYWYSEGVPKEHLDNIKLLASRNVRIKNILIGLDDFSYLIPPEIHLTNLLRQPHPLVTGKKMLIFYSEYFLRMSKFIAAVRKYVLHNVLKRGRLVQNGIVFDVNNTGRMLCRACDELIEKDPEQHMRDDKFSKPTHYEGNNLANTLDAMKEIAKIAKNHHINLVVFVNPIHRTTYLDTDQEQLFAFKKGLSAITDYYDFSGLNTITTNNYYYHETSHYREMVGDMMLGRMFGYPQVAVPADFGVLVTRRNVDDHLGKLSAQITRTRADRADKSTQGHDLATAAERKAEEKMFLDAAEPGNFAVR